jgi:NAD(P)-dependent dehydrogenase (short-subunit alcohol dehydrogenase family)
MNDMTDAATPMHPRQVSVAGQIAVVTGAGRGIGQAIVRALAQSGVTVVAVSRTREELEQTVALVTHDGGTAHARSADVTDQAAVDALVPGVLTEFGPIDIWVNNAGSFTAVGPVWESDPVLWVRDLTTNLVGTFLCARAVLPSMIARRQGVIINLSGGGADEPAPRYTGYGCSKAGILRFTDSLAAEVAEHNIFVYALDPGVVRTAMTEGLLTIPNISPSFVAAMSHTVPPEGAGHLAVSLAALREPRLSGRLFQVTSLLHDANGHDREVSDGVAELVLKAETIARDDLYMLRLRL